MLAMCSCTYIYNRRNRLKMMNAGEGLISSGYSRRVQHVVHEILFIRAEKNFCVGHGRQCNVKSYYAYILFQDF
jgi:hypothetical protein